MDWRWSRSEKYKRFPFDGLAVIAKRNQNSFASLHYQEMLANAGRAVLELLAAALNAGMSMRPWAVANAFNASILAAQFVTSCVQPVMSQLGWCPHVVVSPAVRMAATSLLFVNLGVMFLPPTIFQARHTIFPLLIYTSSLNDLNLFRNKLHSWKLLIYYFGGMLLIKSFDCFC